MLPSLLASKTAAILLLGMIPASGDGHNGWWVEDASDELDEAGKWGEIWSIRGTMRGVIAQSPCVLHSY